MSRHKWDIPVSEYHQIFTSNDNFTTSYLYIITTIFLKATFLTFYLRIFNPTKSARIIIWITLGRDPFHLNPLMGYIL
ncbi:hypothetical protein F5Y11DRAFT_328105 [Daldinia sp. FL1419]|nr:hypothetical protein F5Y11DRAFT_328105 [Daldinia sp. FL1419]